MSQVLKTSSRPCPHSQPKTTRCVKHTNIGTTPTLLALFFIRDKHFYNLLSQTTLVLASRIDCILAEAASGTRYQTPCTIFKHLCISARRTQANGAFFTRRGLLKNALVLANKAGAHRTQKTKYWFDKLARTSIAVSQTTFLRALVCFKCDNLIIFLPDSLTKVMITEHVEYRVWGTMLCRS